MRRKWHLTSDGEVFDPDGAVDGLGPKTLYAAGIGGYSSAYFDQACPGDLVDDTPARGCSLSRSAATARDEFP